MSRTEGVERDPALAPIYGLREEREKLMQTISAEMDQMERRLEFVLKSGSDSVKDDSPNYSEPSRISMDYAEVNHFLLSTLNRIMDLTERIDL